MPKGCWLHALPCVFLEVSPVFFFTCRDSCLALPGVAGSCFSVGFFLTCILLRIWSFRYLRQNVEFYVCRDARFQGLQDTLILFASSTCSEAQGCHSAPLPQPCLERTVLMGSNYRPLEYHSSPHHHDGPLRTRRSGLFPRGNLRARHHPRRENWSRRR